MYPDFGVDHVPGTYKLKQEWQMKLSINGSETLVELPAEVHELLEAASSQQYLEVWLNSDPSEPSLCFHANGDNAWLMFLREAGDSGFSSRNPSYTGPSEAMIDYLLANGQRDWYPAQWAVSRPLAIRAAAYFVSEGRRAPWVEWHAT